MIVVETVAEMRRARASMAGPVALVPTMGALHAGHEALLRAARAAGKTVVASLFVNPTQFGPRENFAGYPRDRARDLRVFRENGVDVVFAPSVEEMYPDGGDTRVAAGRLGELLEGVHRPGHFDGVATVVARLFVAVRPDLAFFGEKDAQQLRVVRRMARDLLFDIEIVGVPTVRDADGVALSSRNAYLDAGEARAARVLSAALHEAERRWGAGERDGAALRQAMAAVIDAEPLAVLDYAAVVDSDTLEDIDRAAGSALALVAATFGITRLIDNALLR
jgi:pantoate--beta-alanine ligase